MSRLRIPDASLVTYAAGAVLWILFATFLVKLYIRRSQFLQLRRQGLVKNCSLVALVSILTDRLMTHC